MLKNYFRVALRNLLKHKSYVFINTFGLGIALACCVTAYILVAYNIEFDDFHKEKKVKNIFRVQNQLLSNEGNKLTALSVASPFAPMAANDISGIRRYTRFASGGSNMSYGINAFSQFLSFADSTFFDMFDFPLVAGSHSSFKQLHTIVINEELAKKFFGDEDPIGKTLVLNFARDVEKKMIVGAVMKKVPINTSMVFQAMIRYEHFEEMRLLEEARPWGDWNVPSTFMELENPEKAASMADLFDRYIPLRNELKTDQTLEKITLHPFKEKVDREGLWWTYLNLRISIEPLIIFISLAAMILLIACFNLTNTSIAMTANRLKEIGVRKSVGAHKGQIVFQFLFETVLVILLALIIGLAVTKVIVPEFTAMWELPYGIEDMSGQNLVITLLILVFLAAILAGTYPALFSSKFNTVALLKGNVRINGTSRLTRTLVALQFSISVIVLIAGVVFIQNTKFQEGLEFGYEKEKLLSLDFKTASEFTAMETKAKMNPHIEEIASTDHHIGYSAYPSPVKFENVDYEVRHIGAGKNYFETVGFKFIYGRPFDVESATDLADAAVISREFIKKVGMQGDPIGQHIEVHGRKKRIVGVIEDFVDNVYQSKDPVPFVFYPSLPDVWKLMIVKADPKNIADVNDFLEASWKESFPSKPYVSRFQEDVVLEGTRQTNGNLKKIFIFLTILGGVLSVTGIFSLASLNIAKRTKEIGIRKALGASIGNVVLLLNREFIIILTAAGVMGSVGGYYGTKWLLDEIYAFHVGVGLIPTILSALFIFAVGILTTSATIYSAARANPVDTLRME